jgi:transcriptional regulator with XRE-family HTH domain
VRYWALYEEEGRRVSEGSKVSGEDGAGRKLAPRFSKHGGYRLPGLKHWRLRRGLSQVDLAQRTEQAPSQLSKIELVQRGCNPALAQRLAEVLEVDLEDLRTKYDDAQEAQTASKLGPRPTTANRYVHRAYLRILLLRVVGSAYVTHEEGELERHCQRSPWEEVIEIVRARKREIEFLKELMEDAQVSAGLPKQVRVFLDGTLEGYPDLDLRVLATARRRESTEEGHEALTKAMRELL